MSAIDSQALAWRRMQAERQLDNEEQGALQAWLEADTRHRGAYIRAAVIDNAIAQAVAHQDIYPPAGSGWERNMSSRRSLFKYGALAAGIAIMGTGMLLNLDYNRATLSTAKGEFRRVALADLSVANINSASKLEVKLAGDKREITLHQGEAWFEVAKDKSKPFIVDAGDVHVRAVGTAFGVHRYPDGAEVMVTEGTVEVWNGQARARLAAGERTFVARRTAQITVARQPEEVQRKLAWIEGKLVFSRQTLGEAVADFNRYSLRKIIIGDPSLEGKRIVGQYQVDAPEQFARDIGAYLNVPIEVSAEHIIIGKKKI